MKTRNVGGLFFSLLLFVLTRTLHADPTGWVDAIDGNGVVWGWVADYSNPGVPIAVHFYVDQLDYSHYAGRIEPSQEYDRSDVWQYFNWKAANHGFSFVIPNSSPNDPSVSFNFRNSGCHRIYAFGIGLNGTPALLNGGGAGGPPPLACLQNWPVSLTQPLSENGTFWIGPNQGAGSIWYNPAPGTGPINGHIEESFGHFDYWPNLNAAMRQRKGGFGIGAAEIGCLPTATLSKFRAANLPVSADPPSFTQGWDGKVLAKLDFDGQSPAGGPDLLCYRFNFCQPSPDRQDPHNGGWFKTKEGQSYTPDEIILDERIPNLVPSFDINTILDGSIPWDQRKAQARRDPCPDANTFNPGVDRITGLINDYVEYANAMRAHFAPNPAPRLSFHWNVIVWWEWIDEQYLDQLHASVSEADFPNALLYVQNPTHHDSQYLGRLVDTMCANGTCPDTAYMDADYLYLTGYAVDVLKRNKAVLEARNVKFGLDLVDACSDDVRQSMLQANPSRDCVITSDGNSLHVEGRDPAQYSPNALYEESVLTLTNFLISKGIIDANTKIRLGPWGRRPIETGSAINENNIGLAHTANRILNEYLIPRGFGETQHHGGLTATYFDNIDFTGTKITRTDSTVNFDWGLGSPDPVLAPTDFSARWEGQVWAGYSETYTFYTVSDDGVRLWVNNQLLIDNWSYHAPTENSASINLVRGQKYNIKLEYFQGGGGATMKLFWSSPSQAKEIIPDDRLFSGTGLRGTYFDHSDFTGVSMTRTDATVDFDWNVGSPALSIPVDNFSARWEGQVWAGPSGTYTFYTVSDDGVRLWVNDQLIIDNWTDHAPTENSGSITLAGGTKYNIKAEFYEHGGGAVMKLLWEGPSQSKAVIPQSSLYPPQ